MSTLAPIPFNTPIVDRDGTLLRQFGQWLIALVTQVQSGVRQVASVTLSDQAASIGTTSLPLGTIAPGLYRISYHLRITQAATTSSSATVTIGYTTGAVSCTQAAAAVTGNTTSTVQGNTLVVKADQASALTYAVAYASVGATPMQYGITLAAELIA